MNRVFGQGFIKFEKWSYMSQLLLKLRALAVPLHFIQYRLDQVKSKDTKTALNSTIQFFERAIIRNIW